MILSIEPGIYLEGKLGIRLENLAFVKKHKNGARQNREYLEFETLTLVPFEKNLIEKKLLSTGELKWINAYHQNVFKKLNPYLLGSEKSWLRKLCKRL